MEGAMFYKTNGGAKNFQKRRLGFGYAVRTLAFYSWQRQGCPLALSLAGLQGPSWIGVQTSENEGISGWEVMATII